MSPLRHTPTGLAAGLSLAAALGLFATTRDYALLGFDSYPILVESRVRDWSDWLGGFAEPLMGGRYPGAFYRPVLNLSFAFDHAVWGLDAFGYQLTNALAFGWCAFALYLLARCLGGAQARVGPWVALAAFALHPAHAEVVPVPARRPELLACALLALGLACQLSPRLSRSGRGGILAGLFFALAMGSKETALVAPGLALVAGGLAAARGGPAARLATALRSALPALLAAAGVLAVRLVVLGHLGGHPASGLAGALGRAAEGTSVFTTLLIAPQPVMQAHLLPHGLVLVGLLGCLVLAASPGAREDERVAAAGRLAALGAAWIALVLAAYAVAGVVRAWYLLLPAAGFALLLGAAGELVDRGLRAPGRALRAAAAASALALALLVVWQARYSLFLEPYPEWAAASRASDEFLEELAARIERAPDGTAVFAPPLPLWVRVDATRPAIYGASILTDYSVQAWAELVFADRRIRVSYEPRPLPEEGELLVVLERLREGFYRRPPEERPRNPARR